MQGVRFGDSKMMAVIREEFENAENRTFTAEFLLEQAKQQSVYIETILYGVVEALTSVFSTNCFNGIITAIGSVKQLLDNFGLDPRKVMKVSIAIANLLEGWNVIYANCDFTN